MSLQLADILPCRTIPRKSAKDKEAPPRRSTAIVAGDTIAKGRTSKKPSKLRKRKAPDSLTSDEQDAEIAKRLRPIVEDDVQGCATLAAQEPINSAMNVVRPYFEYYNTCCSPLAY